MCATGNVWLKWIGDDKIEGRKCFACWLLEALLKRTVHQLQVKPYYLQVQDWSRAVCDPFTAGAFLATDAVPLQPIVKKMQRARLAPATGKCKTCKQGGELLACSFCAANFHNTDACLGAAKLDDALASSASFLWACPACFTKGIAAVQRSALKPTGQRAAGAKRPRKQRKKN